MLLGIIIFYIVIYLNIRNIKKYLYYIIINLSLIGMFINKYAFIIIITLLPLYLIKNKLPNIYNNPIILIYNGKLNIGNLIKNNISIKSIIKYLYDNNEKIDNVKLMYLDNLGKYNLFTDKSSYNNIKPLILNGKLNKDNLKENNKNILWLNNILKLSKLNIKDIYYGYIYNNKLYVVEK